MATGTATLDFGATPTESASVTATGLSGLTTSTHLEAFAQGADTTATNTVDDHKFLATSGRFNCEYVSATSFKINCECTMGQATGTFVVHYATA